MGAQVVRIADEREGPRATAATGIAALLRPQASRDQDIAKDGGAVGHEAIDTTVDQFVHRGRIIDRPHVDIDPHRVGGLDESRLCKWHSSDYGRNRNISGIDTNASAEPRGREQTQYLTRRG
jgi:hypothetical protein